MVNSFCYLTDNGLYSVSFSQNNIAKIMQIFESKQSHIVS